MLEILLRNRIKVSKKYFKPLLIALFFWNLVIYSIPLYLLSTYVITIPESLVQNFSKFVFDISSRFAEFKVESPNVISIHNNYFIITQDCIGYKSLLGFFAILFAIPYPDYKKKLVYSIKVAPILLLANIIRIVSTIALSYRFNLEPKIIHDYLWGFLTNLLVIAFWLLFLLKVRRDVRKFLEENFVY